MAAEEDSVMRSSRPAVVVEFDLVLKRGSFEFDSGSGSDSDFDSGSGSD